MLLKDIINLNCVLSTKGDININIEDLNIDSRKKTENSLFFCISGAVFDSHKFVYQAKENGAIAFVVEKYIDDLDATQVLVDNSRIAMALMSANFYNHPERDMKIIGITGTKGKTTTSFMVKSICESAGYNVGLIGTTGNMIGKERYDSRLTTPDPIDLYATLNLMREKGVNLVVMEVSAHAIDMHRLEGMDFEVSCFTNFSQDHLDYFKDMDTYFEAKKKFFASNISKNAVINADDVRAKALLKYLEIPHIVFAISANADVYARSIEITETGASFKIFLNEGENISVKLNMTGNFNVYNALCAASVGFVLGIDIEDIKEGLEAVKSVPGRIETLETNTEYKVILDYSHSPDSLENILNAVREFTKNRLILLFGCGGDRDHTKRPIMGEIAGKLADICIITSDNPRNENPIQIINAIEEGLSKYSDDYIVIEDRRNAIKHALNIAKEGDIVILAGKGHETYQEKCGVKYPFNEKIIVKELLQEIDEELNK